MTIHAGMRGLTKRSREEKKKKRNLISTIVRLCDVGFEQEKEGKDRRRSVINEGRVEVVDNGRARQEDERRKQSVGGFGGFDQASSERIVDKLCPTLRFGQKP